MTFPPIGTEVSCEAIAYPTGFNCNRSHPAVRSPYIKLWTERKVTPFPAIVTGYVRKYEGHTVPGFDYDDQATFHPHHAIYFLAVRKTPTSREQLISRWSLL